MVVEIRNKESKEVRARYEKAVGFYSNPCKEYIDLVIEFEHEDIMEIVENDEYMLVKGGRN